MTYARSHLPINPYIQKVQTYPLYLLYMWIDGAVCPAGSAPPATRSSTPTPTRSGRICLTTSIKSYPHPLPNRHKVVHKTIPKGVCLRVLLGGFLVRVIRTPIAVYMRHTHKGIVSFLLGGYALRDALDLLLKQKQTIIRNYFKFWPERGFPAQRPWGIFNLSRRQFRCIIQGDCCGI